jgi:integrase
MPSRARPLLVEELQALAGLAAAWDAWDVSLLLLLGYHAILRTSELFSMRVSQVSFAADGRSAFVSLPNTKGSQRKGAPEGVRLTDVRLIAALRRHVASLQPGDTIMRRSAPQFRALFKRLVAAARIEDGVQIYSLRRGGATADFRHHGQLDRTTERGRWGNVRTARIYINTALADSLDTNLSEGLRQHLAACANHLWG